MPLETGKITKRQSKKREYFSTNQLKTLTETSKKNPYSFIEETKALAVTLQKRHEEVHQWFSVQKCRIQKQQADVAGNQKLKHKS